jgi:hypothetical protein
MVNKKIYCMKTLAKKKKLKLILNDLSLNPRHYGSCFVAFNVNKRGISAF